MTLGQILLIAAFLVGFAGDIGLFRILGIAGVVLLTFEFLEINS